MTDGKTCPACGYKHTIIIPDRVEREEDMEMVYELHHCPICDNSFEVSYVRIMDCDVGFADFLSDLGFEITEEPPHEEGDIPF